MTPRSTDAEELERSLLRRAVGTLTAGRHRCSDCGRTPLTGELVHLYRDRLGIVCELCRPRLAELPVSSRTVRHTELGRTVRLVAHAA